MFKKYKALKIIGLILLTIATFFAAINIIPPKKVVTINPFINTDSTPMIAAHRGGGELNPENTLKAFKASVNEYEAEILESDLWLTKDGKLVYNHDHSLNRTSDADVFYPDANNYIEDFTLEELRNFNMGYDFKTEEYKNLVGLDDANRKEVLKNNDLQIVEASELFAHFYETHKDLLFIVEIKNGGEDGYTAADELARVLEEFPDYKDNIVVGTFNTEVENYLKVNHPALFRGASTGAATSFIVTQMLGVNLFDSGDFVCLQIPMEQLGLNLAKKTYVRRAHRRNIAVQYWTIKTAEDMRTCIELGCDAIMVDDPALMQQVLQEYK